MNMLGQQGFPMGSNVGYDGGLNSMGMDVNSMNMGGGMVDMNSMNMGGSMVDMNSMNMGAMNNMGLGSFGGFGMNQLGGGQQGSWGEQSTRTRQASPTNKWPRARTSRRPKSAPLPAATKAKPAATSPPRMQYGNVFGGNICKWEARCGSKCSTRCNSNNKCLTISSNNC